MPQQPDESAIYSNVLRAGVPVPKLGTGSCKSLPLFCLLLYEHLGSSSALTRDIDVSRDETWLLAQRFSAHLQPTGVHSDVVPSLAIEITKTSPLATHKILLLTQRLTRFNDLLRMARPQSE